MIFSGVAGLGSRDSAGFVAAYSVLRLVLVGQYLRARAIGRIRQFASLHCAGFGMAASLWLAAAVSPGRWLTKYMSTTANTLSSDNSRIIGMASIAMDRPIGAVVKSSEVPRTASRNELQILESGAAGGRTEPAGACSTRSRPKPANGASTAW